MVLDRRVHIQVRCHLPSAQQLNNPICRPLGLTPLTNADSSPSRTTSPNQYKSGTPATNSTWLPTEKAVSQDDVLQAQPALADQPPSDPRVYARDPNKGVKGSICTYDPLLDRKLSSNEKKKAKPIYKDFGLVRIIQSLGSVILLV
jgi:hypothetical protein